MTDESLLTALFPEEVVTRALVRDVELPYGVGWPFHLGGITPYLDRAGISEKVTGTRFHL